MIAECTTCKARYRVADEKVRPGGTKFKCKKCGSLFRVHPPAQESPTVKKPPQRPRTKRCPHCGQGIPIEAVKCRHCGRPVGEEAARLGPAPAGGGFGAEEEGGAPGYAVRRGERYGAETPGPGGYPLQTRAPHAGAAAAGGDSHAQPAWQLVLLSMATLGIYELYWFYRNWKHFRDHRGWDVSPGWRTAGLVVPVLGLVLAYYQLKDVREYLEKDGIRETYSPGWVLFGWLALSALWRLPDPFWLLSSFSVFPLVAVQGPLNAYWEKEQPGARIRTSLSGGQIALLVLGVAFWVLVIVGMLLPE